MNHCKISRGHSEESVQTAYTQSELIIHRFHLLECYFRGFRFVYISFIIKVPLYQYTSPVPLKRSLIAMSRLQISSPACAPEQGWVGAEYMVSSKLINLSNIIHTTKTVNALNQEDMARISAYIILKGPFGASTLINTTYHSKC